MKEMKTQLILFSLLLLGSTAWAQQPCLSQDAYREKVEAYSQILKQQKLKTLPSRKRGEGEGKGRERDRERERHTDR